MIKKLLAFSIIFLFIGTSVVSSTDNISKDISADCSSLKSVYNSEEKFSYNTTWYVFIVGGGEGTGFYAFYPNGTSRFREWEGNKFFSGGTWTNDGRYLCCMYENGTLYDINPKTLEACAIGDGGVSLNGLAYNPVTERLYGASSQDLYEINITTGEQTYIGAFGIDDVKHMIAIAFDIDGICYGWDVCGEASLYKINTSTGEATIVGGMGINLCYAQDGAFDYETDILYLTAYTPGMGGWLLECDEDTGECYLLGFFQGEATAHAISYEIDNEPPVTKISFDPPEPNGCNGWYVSNVTVILNATDNSGVKETYYRINGGEWEIYESPFVISEDGNDILIEYYSVDIDGNVENVKSASLDIDQTPPNITVEWVVEKIGWRKWQVTFYISFTDNTSGIDRLEIYLNDVLQETIYGPGPTYAWSCIIYGGNPFSFKSIGYDCAGNQAFVVVNSSDINSESIIKSQNHFNILLQILNQLKQNLYDKLTTFAIFSKSLFSNAG